MTNITYPFDPSGVATTNLVTGETHTVTEANYRDYFFIVPVFAPFFAESLTVSYAGAINKILTPGIDYYCAIPFLGATRAIGKPVYGGITLNSLITIGTLTISYQTLGGAWVVDQQFILRQLAEKTYNPRTITWEQVSNAPEVFPPIPHQWNLIDMVGEKDILSELSNIEAAILNTSQTNLSSHVNNFNNPHRVTKTQLGLENVGNWARATVAETKAGLSTDTLVVPSTLRALLMDFYTKIETNALLTNQQTQIDSNDQQIALTATDILRHLLDFNNPHKVSKGDVGLGLVENLMVVSPAEVDLKEPVHKYLTFDMFLRYMDVYGSAVMFDAPHLPLYDCLGNIIGYVYSPIVTRDPLADIALCYSNGSYLGFLCRTATAFCPDELLSCEGVLLGYFKATGGILIPGTSNPTSVNSMLQRNFIDYEKGLLVGPGSDFNGLEAWFNQT